MLLWFDGRWLKLMRDGSGAAMKGMAWLRDVQFPKFLATSWMTQLES
jgi:hypothetical protein